MSARSNLLHLQPTLLHDHHKIRNFTATRAAERYSKDRSELIINLYWLTTSVTDDRRTDRCFNSVQA